MPTRDGRPPARRSNRRDVAAPPHVCGAAFRRCGATGARAASRSRRHTSERVNTRTISMRPRTFARAKVLLFGRASHAGTTHHREVKMRDVFLPRIPNAPVDECFIRRRLGSFVDDSGVRRVPRDAEQAYSLRLEHPVPPLCDSHGPTAERHNPMRARSIQLNRARVRLSVRLLRRPCLRTPFFVPVRTQRLPQGVLASMGAERPWEHAAISRCL